MKVLLAHNFYQQPGGEDTVFRLESAMLEKAGHTVFTYQRSNAEILEMGILEKLTVPTTMIWARDSTKALRTLLEKIKPDLVHFHNTFMFISPAAYSTCQRLGIPVVQSLHNPRLLCPASSFYRQGSLCSNCLGQFLPWPGIVHGCYRESRLQTAMVAAMVTTHRLLQTWNTQVDRYIVFSEFYKHKFIQGGLPANKISIKPHFVNPDPGPRHESNRGGYALFVGRLDPEKGVRTLLRAWKYLSDIPLKIRGDGQLLQEVNDYIKSGGTSVEIVERLSEKDLFALMKGASFLVWPSEGYYECFGLVAIQAFACAIPVIASRTGVMTEIVKDHRTGLHFKAGDPEDLASKARWAWEHPRLMFAMGRRGRSEFEQQYTEDKNYSELLRIYKMALGKTAI
jgi:glycosyltransferase involved in cell wall biosynthesis